MSRYNYVIKFRPIKYPNIEEIEDYYVLKTAKYSRVLGKVVTEDSYYDNSDIVTSLIIPDKYIISIENIY